MKAVLIFSSLIFLVLFKHSYARGCTGIGDIVFLVDSSTSVGPISFEKVKSFVNETVSSMQIGPRHVRVGLVAFNTKTRTQFMLSTYKTKIDVMRAVAKTKFTEGVTFLGEAFRYVRLNFNNDFRRNVPKVLVLISDGNSNGNLNDVKQATLLKATGVQIIAVGAAKNIDRKDMRRISTHGKMFHVGNVNALKSILKKVRASTCKVLKPSVKPCYGFPVDIMFVMDSSTSVGDKNWIKQKRFLLALIKPFKISRKRSRVGLITYNTMARVVFNIGTLNSYRAVRKAILGARYSEGVTFTGTALKLALEKSIPRFRKGNVARVVILVTDGRSNGFVDPVGVAKKIKDQGVHLLTVGITNQINKAKLKKISSDHAVFTSGDFDKLKGLIHKIRRRTCKYSQNAKTKKAAEKIQKKKEKKREKKQKKVSVKKCKRKIDLVFVLDSSSSVGPYNWKEELKFLTELAAPLDVDSGNARVALVTYNTFVKERFGLGTYKTMKALRRAIKKVKFTEGTTFTGEALRKVLSSIVPHYRKGVRKIVVLVTDGRTNGFANPVRMAAKLKKLGVVIYSIGITKQIDVGQLKAISSSGKIFKVKKQVQLENIAPEISNTLCK